MRRILFSVLIFCVFTTSGCMVMDEIDSAAAKMPATKNKKSKKPAAPEATSAGAGVPQKNAILEQSRQWWESATSLAPGNVEPSIVSCQLSGTTQFMSKDDCLTRGGQPRGVSG